MLHLSNEQLLVVKILNISLAICWAPSVSLHRRSEYLSVENLLLGIYAGDQVLMQPAIRRQVTLFSFSPSIITRRLHASNCRTAGESRFVGRRRYHGKTQADDDADNEHRGAPCKFHWSILTMCAFSSRRIHSSIWMYAAMRALNHSLREIAFKRVKRHAYTKIML